MAVKDRIKVADLDVNALRTEIKAVTPRTVSYQEALDKIRDPLIDKVKEGAAIEDLAAALGRQGLKVSARGLKTYIETGEYPTKTAVPSEPSGVAEGFTAETSRPAEVETS